MQSMQCHLYLEDVGLLGGELCELEAVVPLLVPGDDAALQQQRLPHHGVAPALLLQQQQRGLATPRLAGEPGEQ